MKIMKRYCELSRHEGNQTLFDLVEMSIASTYAGEPFHVHAEGLRGTGKTTIMRAARDILPSITRIAGCLYNCDPAEPHCPQHRDLSPEEIAAIGTEEITMPFLEISHSAKVGTVAGSIDLAKITDPNHPEAALLPGILPQAHRGIVFIDEINRLADTSPEITDILLDVMGQKPGRIQIEEAGLPVVEIPLMVTVWAASNPDEDPGPLEEVRRQLSDRFDMVFYMGRPTSVEVVAEILATKDRPGKKEAEEDKIALRHAEFRERIVAMAKAYAESELPDFLRNFIARIYLKHNLESLRAIEAIQQGALLYSLLRKRPQPNVADVINMIPLALKHRVEGDTLVKIMNSLETRSPRETLFGFKGRPVEEKAPAEPKAEEKEETFAGGARRIKELSRSELIATEKTLTPPD